MKKLALLAYTGNAIKSFKRFLFACTFILIILHPLNIVAQASEFGVNLSGLEFGPGSLPGTAGTNFFVPTAAEFTYYSSFGLKLFRIPFLWERMQPTLGSALSTTYLAYLDGVVAAAATAGVSVYIDCHNYARYPQNGNVITSAGGPTQAQFNDLWTKLATHYASNSTVWGYDIMNEPNTLGGANWPAIAQSAINAIRAVDTKHVILVEGNQWAQGHNWVTNNPTLNTITDPNNNLVFEAHQYFDSNESGTYPTTTMAGNNPLGAANTVTSGVTLITPFVNWIKTNNFRGMVGEYGIPNNNDQANWNSLLDNFLNYLQQNCILGTYWAGGPGWGNSYVISSEPLNNNYTTPADERSQMPTLAKYTGFISSCSPIGSVQPVTFSSFTLNANNSSVSLYWTTASELNNNYFTIERSSDGHTFEGIGQVKGTGTTTVLHNYSFIDASPPGGTAYYRLAQYDYDGNVSYSKVISTTTENKIQVVVAPNPFTDETNLIVTGAPQTPVHIKVFDLTGKIMYSGVYTTNEGIIFGSGLNAGLYLLQVQVDERSYVLKIVKQ